MHFQGWEGQEFRESFIEKVIFDLNLDGWLLSLPVSQGWTGSESIVVSENLW